MLTPVLRHPRKALLLCAVLTLPFLWLTTQLSIDQTANGMTPKSDPDKLYYHEVQEAFGGGLLLTIVLSSDDLFTETVLQQIEDLTYATENLKYVSRVVSLSTVFKLKWEDGFLDTDQVMAYVPMDPTALQAIRDYVQQDDLLLKEVLSPDGKTTAINVFIEDRPNNSEYLNHLTAEVDALLAKTRRQLGPEVEVFATGTPYIQAETARLIKKDQTRLIPISILVILLVLFAFYRSLLACLIPIATGSISIAITLGFMRLFDFAINPISGTIPILLMIIGSTEDIHLLADYIRGLEKKDRRDEAVQRMMQRSITAICLTSLTTFLGFATISSNTIPVLKEFGIAASLGIAVNFLVTIILVPAILLIYPAPKRYRHGTRTKPQGIQEIVALAATFTLKFKPHILIACFGSMAIAIVGCFKVTINTDFLTYFQESSSIRQQFDKIDQQLAGGYSFYVVVEAPKPGGIQQPHFLKDIARLEDFLEERFNKVLGYGKLIRRINQEMSEGDPAAHRVPKTSDLIEQYTLMIDQQSLDRFLDYDAKRACIVVRSSDGSSEFLRAMKAETQAFAAAELSQDLKLDFSGQLILIGKAADLLSRGIVMNILLMLITIFIIISCLYMNPRAGALSLFPNLFPILINFGVMGWFAIPLSIGTFSVAIIALGIAVDDTIHFLSRYNNEIKRHSDQKEAMKRCFEHEFSPVLSTSLALIIGFSILSFSGFGTISQFGLLAAIAIGSAFIGDIFFTPCLLLNLSIISSWDYFKLKINVDSVKKNSLLEGLTIPEVKKLALLGQLEEYESGDRIIQQGATDRDIYLILNGRAEVYVHASNDPIYRKVASIRPGEVIGEMAFIAHEQRTADVIAVEPLQALVINSHTLERLTQRYSKIAVKVYRNLSKIVSKRLVATTRDGSAG